MTHKKVCLAGPAGTASLAARPVAATAAPRAPIAKRRRRARPPRPRQSRRRHRRARHHRAARQVERLAEQLVQQKNLPGLAMAIVQDGKVVSHARLRPYRRARPASRSGTDTVFRLASLSKAFAATLSAQLVAEGAMSWDSPIINQLPAFKLRDYAGATQGDRARRAQPPGRPRPTTPTTATSRPTSPTRCWPSACPSAPMACTPGDCYAYQNIAFSLIGDLVFAATGDFYSHQVEKRIFHPLGMYNATYGRDALEASASWARPHVRGRGGWVPVRPKETYYRVPPAAGVNASIHDMAQWLIAQTGHRPDVLPPRVLDQIHTPQVTTPGETARLAVAARAPATTPTTRLGWRVFDYAGHTLVFHGGAVQGYRGLIALPARARTSASWCCGTARARRPPGLLPTLMDRVLGLPTRDWLGVEDDGSRRLTGKKKAPGGA